MNLQSAADIALGLIIVGVLAFRQLTWRYVDPARIWRLPVILGIIGLVELAGTHMAVGPADIGFFALEAIVGIAVGLGMGFLTTYRIAPQPDQRGRSVQARTGGWGAALWIVLIATRVGIDVLAGMNGAHLAASGGSILLVLAINRAARAFVMDQRLPRERRIRA
ncbi:hypothetical protein [Curtobacterium ammoniigenes]|uniref:hypothetical protein n=1 Tax=Curtobacterium ammoniigenes TaxID=395387 RepID=UPI0008374398|nr:hypothetical protein [Curtobacterium ammoniigenes]